MKPRHYWYGIVKKQIMISKENKPQSLQRDIIASAMREADRETKKLPNGDLRMKAVNDILIKQTKNYVGVGLEVNYSSQTVKNWITSYVNLVGKKAGY